MSAINPATNELIKELKFDSLESLKDKFERTKNAQKSWRNVPLAKRIQCIKEFAALLLENKEELARELTMEVGKPIKEALGEVAAASHKCEFFIEQSQELLKKNQVNVDGDTKEILDYDPLGVIGHISAWNYPYLVGINIFVPALICGNAVMYKPSEYSSLVGESVARMLWQAGVPKDVFQIVLGKGDVGAALTELALDGYFFTGSYATGKKIATAVAQKLVPVGLELGGKDPLYVTEEVPSVKDAAENAAGGAFYNNGQSCCSVERIYVHEKIYDEFTTHFVNKAKDLKVGDPLDPNTEMGAITRKEHLPYLEGLVDDALGKGAKLECGGKRVGDLKGNFFAPTVLTNVHHGMDIMREETFGPLIGIQKVKSDEEAIELMNDTDYGLASAVFTSNKDRGEKILADINSGTGYLNCCDRVSGYLPWSGRGHSGLGTTLSKHGLYAFCHPKGYHIRGF